MSTYLPTLHQHASSRVSRQGQERLNQPLPHTLPEEHQRYFQMIYQLLEEKKIQPVSIASILHSAVYDKLPEASQAQVDLEAFNLLHLLRELHKLFLQGHGESHQARQLVETVWQIKERVERKHGDVFIV